MRFPLCIYLLQKHRLFYASIYFVILCTINFLIIFFPTKFFFQSSPEFTTFAPTSPKRFRMSPYMQKIFGWMNISNIENYKFKYYHDFSKCTLCNFTPHNPRRVRTDSFDLAFSFLIGGSLAGLQPFIQSLRTTGCLAQIVLFVDNITKAKILEITGDFTEDCGVNLVDIGYYVKYPKRRFIYYIKHYLTSFFFNSHVNMFNRVLVSDFVDVVFQGNPFLMPWPDEENTIVMSPEYEHEGRYTYHFNMTANGEREVGILKVFAENLGTPVNFTAYTSGEKQYFNAGVVFTSEKLIRYHGTEISNLVNSLTDEQFERLGKINNRIEEQCVHNIIINERFIPNKDIYVLCDGPNHELFMMVGRRKVVQQKFPDFKYKKKTVLLYHLIHYHNYYCMSIQEKCFNTYNISNYIRCSLQY
ncbi:hypothetical protein TRFO_23990 [Tritrichomonas foetus]|uniref:Uncharacterized protein n=1 Tax=Tritrichomonas foetus TaxID=1144522 RepID=A0A1J4KDL0_9EUKA|nr:hypothetical protein TRFO_23990 [Tritrichomonas foetus]|eukprot:OHT07718.1 hypothetical protein TRFO_23990 [Tritrichomonas foetus]